MVGKVSPLTPTRISECYWCLQHDRPASTPSVIQLQVEASALNILASKSSNFEVLLDKYFFVKQFSMEHLGIIQNPYLQPVEIRCISATPGQLHYDNLEFHGFPERCGIDKEHLLRRGHFDAFFAQQWLWFGLLSAFTDHMWSISRIEQEFTTISSESGQKVVTTARLEHYLREWRSGLSEDDLLKDSPVVDRINTMLHVVERLVSISMSIDGDAKHPMRNQQELSLSIMSLGVVLTKAKMKTWPGTRLFSWGRSQLVRARLEQAGWCPSDVTMLDQLMTPSGGYFATLLRPRLQAGRHDTHCDRAHCMLMNISGDAKSTYKPKHVVGCDKTCKLIDSTQFVVDILENDGEIALVKYSGTAEQKADLNVLGLNDDNRSKVNFVAISHVWVEGLGNTQTNALPECQLLRLQSLVDQASGQHGTPFWIDTLCIPQDSVKPQLRHLRRAMVDSMSDVYRKSTVVLVLDAEMASVSQTATAEELCLRFACSNWMRRLWTLQEAVTGSKVLLQLSDGRVDLFQELYNMLHDHPRLDDMTQTLLTELGQFMRWMRYLRGDDKHSSAIASVWNACQFRSVTEAHDEVTCIRTIAGLPPPQPGEESDIERWKAFILEQRIFPKDFLFVQGPKLECDGFRWAPATFIRRPATQMATVLPRIGNGIATPSGLTFTAPGLTFKPPHIAFRPEAASFWMYLEHLDRWYWIGQKTAPKDKQPSWAQLREELQDCSKLGIVLALEIIDSKSLTINSMGALVDLSGNVEGLERSSGTLFGRYMATVNVALELGSPLKMLGQLRDLELSRSEKPYEGCWTVDGAVLSPDQQWCIG